MLRCQRLDAVKDKHELKVNGLLGPQGAVIVEHCDAVARRNEGRTTLSGDVDDELDDRLLRRTIVPGRQKLRDGCARKRPEQTSDEERK